jgi:CheY-like chemotaxis protein
MPKVLLVEDDNNLREIFQMRLQAEGYITVVAADGEEGLVVAMKEKPDLVVADVMMPKLSGFEMLENLRSSPEMKDTKVIMMTALGQAEDQARGEKLGVVKYLVKSQVTLEDFARVVKEVLGPGDPKGAAAATPAASTPTNQQESEGNMQDPQTNPSMPTGGDQPAPAGDSPAPAAPDMGSQQSTADEQQAVQSQINSFTGGAPDTSAAPAGDTPAPAGDSGTSAPADTSAPQMPPATDQPGGMGDSPAPATPPAGGDQPAGGAPTDPTSNAL